MVNLNPPSERHNYFGSHAPENFVGYSLEMMDEEIAHSANNRFKLLANDDAHILTERSHNERSEIGLHFAQQCSPHNIHPSNQNGSATTNASHQEADLLMVERLNKQYSRVLDMFDFPEMQAPTSFYNNDREPINFLNSGNDSLSNSGNQGGISNLLNKENALKSIPYNVASSFLVPQPPQVHTGMDDNNLFSDIVPTTLNEQIFQECHEERPYF